jgi:regulator of sirC expression with transglutaminase-like and TPR domain
MVRMPTHRAANLDMSPDVVATVQSVLSLPDDELDYARAKLTFDRIIDASIDIDATMAELDQMAEDARCLAGPSATDAKKLAALRKLIYESGPWNGHRPFHYDHADFKNLRVKLVSHYLDTRLGNCVSMPVLFLILADKLGLHMALAMAPVHLFLRHLEGSGRTTNLETTSGALPARDIWIRETRRVTDLGVASGFYMRSLSRREGVAAMAMTVVEHLRGQRRDREAVPVLETILRHNPRDGMAWANLGDACLKIGTEFLDRYGSEFLIPVPLRPGYLTLLQRNHAAFHAARALGWEPIQ